MDTWKQKGLELLQQLVSIPSFSREENQTADLIERFLVSEGLSPQRIGNNIWCTHASYNEHLPTVLLNSHHDTVRPVSGWESDPFDGSLLNDRITALGSNDAGASLVALIMTFLYFKEVPLTGFNLLLAASAEEEISGKGGVELLRDYLPPIAVGIVGEPTQMQMAIAERGLIVVDGEVKGKAGHAARGEGINAIYRALPEIEKLKNFQFDKVSSLLGPVKISITQIQAGVQHNVVPDQCTFVMDIRTQERYSNKEVISILQKITQAKLRPRSLRLNASGISEQHPLVRAGKSLGMTTFGSATLSDQALWPFDTIKIGCGNSARSHTAGEYIEVEEFNQGLETYIALIKTYEKTLGKGL